MKCPNCGFENIPESTLCLNCKSDLAVKEAPLSSKKEYSTKRPSLKSKITYLGKRVQEVIPPQLKKNLVNPRITWIFSVIPGLSQFIAGRYYKGLIIFILWIVLISYYLYSFNGFVFTILFLLHTYSFLECVFARICLERSEGIRVSILVVLLVTVIYYGFHTLINLRVERVIVPGNYWSPTLKNRDIVLFDKKSYRNEKPQRGDIVLYKPSTGYVDSGGRRVLVQDTGQSLERIIGLPGDMIKIVEGKIWVNGKELPEELYPLNSNALSKDFEETVPEGSYLLMQTYFPEWYSRFRTIPESSIIGRITRSYHPFLFRRD